MNALGLPAAVSVRTISTLFGVSAEFIGAIRRAPLRYYRKFSIKKGKKTREIHAPRVALKVIQRWIGAHIAAAIELPDCVFGFVPGRSVAAAADVHCDAKWVYSLDLRDFFPSVSETRVHEALTQIGYSNGASNLVTRLCTLHGGLPQGSPASPPLSNIVFRDTDGVLRNIAIARGVRYSRYADDLVFSGIEGPPSDLQEQVNAALAAAGWNIAPEKEHLAQLPNRLKVHGLLVHGRQPRLTKGYRNKVRAFRHLDNSGKVRPDELRRIRGHLAYADSIDKFNEKKK